MDPRSQQLIDLAILMAAAFGACLAITPAVRFLARRWGMVDNPDGRRKIHVSPIPVAGGVAIYLTVCLVLLVAAWKMPAWVASLQNPEFKWVRLKGWLDLDARLFRFSCLFAAATVIAIIGIIDDTRGMRGRYKLAGQCLAVMIVIFGGVKIDSIRVFGVMVPQLFGELQAWVFTAFWLLGAINALNLIDGMDGLLGSVGLIACLTIGGLAFLNGNFAAACVALTMAGALLGFLWYNFPPATIFLGDAGSMLIGLVVGTLSIEASLKGTAVALGMVPLALMIVPIFDTSAAILRRSLTGRSIYTTDRGHLHHVLMLNGLSNRKVLMMVGLLSAFAGAAALASQYMQNDAYAILGIAVVGVFLIVSRLFGYAEFLLVKERVLTAVDTVRNGQRQGRVHDRQFHLQGSANWNDLWRQLTVSAEQLRLRTLCLDVNAPQIHEGYHARWDRTHHDPDEVSGYWRLEVPLTVNRLTVGRLEVVGLRDEDSAWLKLAAIAKIVEDIELAIAALTAAQQAPPAPPLRPAEGVQLERV